MARYHAIYDRSGNIRSEYQDGILISGYELEEIKGPLIFGDLPDYESPVTGKIISGRVQRREDLKRNQCRPYEGIEQERKESARHKQYAEQDLDRYAQRIAETSYQQMPENVKRILNQN